MVAISDKLCSGQHVAILDGWRGLAISLVLLNHFFLPGGMSFGRLGVDVFFVLSGLLMSNILFVKRTDLRTFYKRRVSRIFPVFILYVSLFYGLSSIFSLSSEHENFFYTVFFLRSYLDTAPNIWNTGIPVGHLWSLNVEEHCYIFLSLLTLFTRIPIAFKGVILLVVGVMCICMNYLYMTTLNDYAPYFWQVRTEVVASHLLISAGYFLVKRSFGLQSNPVLLSLAIVLACLCYAHSSPLHWSAKWSISPILLAYIVNHLEASPKFVFAILNNKHLQLLGVWSYSIYLWQQPFYFYLSKHGAIFPMANVVGLVLAIIAGYLSYSYIENPTRRFLNKKWS